MPSYRITVLHPDNKTTLAVHSRKPDLKTLQALVGGLIQLVPHWTMWEGQRAEVWCNENGRIHDLPFNPLATQKWKDVLGKGPFSYEPKLFGDVAIVQKLKLSAEDKRLATP